MLVVVAGIVGLNNYYSTLLLDSACAIERYSFFSKARLFCRYNARVIERVSVDI